MTILIIDNYDSFTYNLYQQIGELSQKTPLVHRNDEITLREIETISPSHIVLSPGPGHPSNSRDFGVCKELITQYKKDTPILGVCLGHQGIIAHNGGDVVAAPTIVHGKVDTITHDQDGLFRGLPSPLKVMRYHSLVGRRSTLPACLRIVAQTTDELIMAVSHVDQPLFGLQFHPESIGTPKGNIIMRNFLEQ